MFPGSTGSNPLGVWQGALDTVHPQLGIWTLLSTQVIHALGSFQLRVGERGQLEPLKYTEYFLPYENIHILCTLTQWKLESIFLSCVDLFCFCTIMSVSVLEGEKCLQTHIKEGFLLNVFRCSHGRCSHCDRFHVRQLNHTFTVFVLPAVVISQLEKEPCWRQEEVTIRTVFFSLGRWGCVINFTSCFVLSSTNHLGFHGFSNAPLLYKMPSKLLMGKKG